MGHTLGCKQGGGRRGAHWYVHHGGGGGGGGEEGEGGRRGCSGMHIVGRGTDLIDEDDGGSLLPCHGKQLLDKLLALTHPLGHQGAGSDAEEGGICLCGQCLQLIHAESTSGGGGGGGGGRGGKGVAADHAVSSQVMQ